MNKNENRFARCFEKHGDDFDYAQTDFNKVVNNSNVFICKKHGQFNKSIRDFLRVEIPCEICQQVKKSQSRSINLKNGFVYDKTDFDCPEGAPNIVTCIKHGDIQVSICDHKRFQSGGCGKCEMEYASLRQRMSKDDFVKKAELHQDHYDYSKVHQFKNQHEPVTIICNISNHGDFQQTPANHLHKTKPQGCPKCGQMKGANLRSLNLGDFINKALLVHGDKYDYSDVYFSRTTDKINIKCNKCHDIFTQKVSDHLSGSGCVKCARDRSDKSKKFLTTEIVVARCKEVWGDTYDYSDVEWVSDDVPITIVCKKHGKLSMDYQNHVGLGRGCKFCGSTRRKKQNDWLDYVGLPSGEKYREVTIRFSDKTYCFADGYDPIKLIVYEFNGDYFHGNPSKYSAEVINRFTGKTMSEEFERTSRKKAKLIDAGYSVIDIWEMEWDVITKSLISK